MLCRRSTLAVVFLLALSSAQPGFAQAWLQRYLSEHKKTDDSNGTQYQDQATPAASGSQTAPGEVRRALPADGTAAPAAPPDSPPVARALPADGSEPPPTPPDANTPPAPAAPASTPIPVRRAMPVAHDEEPIPKQPDATPAPVATPSPAPRAHAKTSPAPPASTPAPSPNPPTLTVAPATPPPAATPTPVQATEPAPPKAVAVEPSPTASPSVSGTDPTDSGNVTYRLTPGAAPLPPDVIQFRLANDLYSAKQFQRAAPEFERYLSMFPNGADREKTTFLLAESYRQIGSVNAAKRNYEALLYTFENSPFTGTAACRLADICFEAKDWSEALTFYRKASVEAKDPAIVLGAQFNAAYCLDQLKMVEDAITAYEDILATKENNPYREESQFALARLNLQAGKKEQAMTYLTSLRSETGKAGLKAEATVRIGLLLLDLDQKDKAVAELTKALQMPEVGAWKEPAQVGLFRVLYKQSKYKAVLDTYGASDKQFSATVMPEVLLIVANSNRQLFKYEAACPLYDQVIRDYPNTSYAEEAGYQRIAALYYIADADKVAREADAYLEAHPNDSDRRASLTLLKGESYYKASRFAEAAKLYGAIDLSKLPPEFDKADTQYKLGLCYAQTSQYDQAVRALSDFLDAYPASKLAPTALAQRALSRQQLSQLKEALADYDTIIKRYPQSRKEREIALFGKAKILGQPEDKEPMVEAFTQFLKEFPKSRGAGEANYWIGSAAAQNKNYRESIAPLENARALDKKFADAHQVTALLLAAHKELEERDAEAAEVDRAVAGSKYKVPAGYLHWLGGEYLKAGEFAKAEKYLKMLTSRGGGEDAVSDDWLNLGRACNQLGKWSEAEGALNTYLKGVTDSIPLATGYLELGHAQLGGGKLDAAQKSADQVLEKQLEGALNSEGRMLQGDISMARGDFEGAAKEYLSISILCAEDPKITPESLDKAYKAYKAAGNEAQAAKLLNDLQSKYPEYQAAPGKSVAKP